MKVLTVGGGSGGHVTPVIAVVRQLKVLEPSVSVRFWCDKGFSRQARSMFGAYDQTVPVAVVASGKFRRYHHLPMWRQLLMPSIVFPNIRDGVKVVGGFIQSFFKLLLWRPDVVFTKGGYVCLPVGMAAKVLRIPLVIHDSDAHPGLTNRVLSRWASAIGTGAPLEHYSYPKNISQYVGVPVDEAFHPLSVNEKLAAKERWDVDQKRPLVVVTGGGLGARRINDAVMAVLPELLEIGTVVLISGKQPYDDLKLRAPQDKRFRLIDFVHEDMVGLLGAADVVVTRAGATTILELAAVATPTILVPNARLTGGHQVKNAQVYAKSKAVIVLDEDDLFIEGGTRFVAAVKELVENKAGAKEMAERFHQFARPNAASDMAHMILSKANQ